jgi:cytochrome P450
VPEQSFLVIPPAPVVHPKELSTLRLALTAVRNSLEIWPESAFDLTFSRNKVLGVENVLISDPAGIRHVMAENAMNYVRPTIMPRLLRPLVGHGLFLAEGTEWRRQRRQLSSVFTPSSVSSLLPHFLAAANDLMDDIKGDQPVDLEDAYQGVALNAVLRALFSLPDRKDRDRVGNVVRQYITGPGRPQVLDGLARTETAFSFALGGRRAFQKRWTALVDSIVADRRRVAPGDVPRDLLDLLFAARDPETGGSLSPAEIRDQAATMIFAGYETTARLLFWASYLLTLDQREQSRVHAEVSAFPPNRIRDLKDLENWPRLRMTLLETLRLYPPVPMLIREPLEDDVILGEPVRRGVQVYIAPWVLHRHRKYWKEPTAFMPDRFANQASPWTSGGGYMPFGAGPRICIGAMFAMAEAQIILATLLHSHRLSMDDPKPLLPVGRLTTQPSHTPDFILLPRQA